MQKGKLTNVEKDAIQGMLHDNKSTKEIAVRIDRTKASVEKYINTELDNLQSTIAHAQATADPDAEPEGRVDYEPIQEKPRRFATITDDDVAKVHVDEINTVKAEDIADRGIIMKVFKELRQAGLTEQDTNGLIRSVLEWAANNGQKYKSVELLYTACITRMNAGHWITKVTAGGNEGVAIMSGAASVRGDEARKNAKKTVSRSARGHIWKPKEGEMM